MIPILLDHRFDERWLRRAPAVDAARLSVFDFSTSVMTGDLVFLVDGGDFSYVGYGIPLLEMARGLVLSITELEHGAALSTCSPLDIEEELTFVREAETVTITSELSGDRASVRLPEISAAVRSHAKRLLLEFTARFPAAKHNSVLFAWYPESTDG